MPAGFEPAHPKGNGLAGRRGNHCATAPWHALFENMMIMISVLNQRNGQLDPLELYLSNMSNRHT